MGVALELAEGFDGSVGSVGGACVGGILWHGNRVSIVGGPGGMRVHAKIFGGCGSQGISFLFGGEVVAWEIDGGCRQSV